MKRLVVAIVLLVVIAVPLMADEYVWIDRVEEGGRMLVPLRGVFEAVGATVDWTAATQEIDIALGAKAINMKVDYPIATVDGTQVALSVPPRNLSGRVHIPLRFAGEALGRTVDYQGDRVVLTGGVPIVVLLITGEAAGVPASGTVQPPPPPSPPPAQNANATLAITSPVEGQRVPPRIEVYGTAPGGTMIVVNTEARAQDDGHLLKTVPGLRHSVNPNGSWHVAVAAPVLPANVSEPLYYVVKAYYATPGFKSPEVSVTVYRQ